jgi:hypothetical protein
MTRYLDPVSPQETRKEGCVMATLFQHYHYRQRGPINALQMRLQG